MQLSLHADTSAALPLRCWHAAVPPRRRLCSLPIALWACSSSSRLPPLQPSLHAANVHRSRLLLVLPPQRRRARPHPHAASLPPCWPPYCHTPCARPGIPSRHPYCCRTPCIASSNALLDTWATAASRTAAASVPPAQRRSPFNEHWLNCKLICCPDGTQQPSTSPCTAATRAAAPRVPSRPERRRGLSPPDWRYNLPRCVTAARR
jgi:hypothetical protein